MFTLGLVAHATLVLINLNIIACNVHPKSSENSIYMGWWLYECDVN
jgi:hypothetical protein